MEINNSALVMIYKGELSNEFSILNNYQMVILTEIINLEAAEILDQYCRSKKIAFVYAVQFGLSSLLFTDFGEDFLVEDFDGKKGEKYFIKSITNSCPGIVEIEPIVTTKGNKTVKHFLKLGTGDFVTFKDISGMNELNDTPPRPIRVLSKTKFTIEDTSKFEEFTGSGMVEKVKIPYPIAFKPLSEAKNCIYNEDLVEDDLDDDNIFIDSDDNNSNNVNESDNNGKNDWIKMFYSSSQNKESNDLSNEKIHLAVLSLHEFFNVHQYLPHFNFEKDIDECLEISKKILEKSKEGKHEWAMNLKGIDKIFMKKIFKFSRFYFTPMTCFFGGIASQEILKYVGLYRPNSQWTYFHFLDLIDNEALDENKNSMILDDEFKRNVEPYILIGKEKINQLKSSNILIIGLNTVGYEILKILIMLEILTKNSKVTILEFNEDEINEKMDDLKRNDKNCNINIISEKIDLNGNLSEKDWWIKSTIIINTLSFKKYNKEKIYIIKNCKKYNKILFNIGTNKTIGLYELVLPKQLLNTDKNNELCFYNENETPEGPSQKDKNKEDKDNNSINENCINEINIDEEPKHNKIYSLEESITWSKDFLYNIFNINIKHLNELINRSNSEKEMKKYIDDLIEKEKDNKKILKLVRTFKKLISLKMGMSFDTVVFFALETFQELFEFSIDEIYQKYPEDLMDDKPENKISTDTEDKNRPIKISFNINNKEHFELIYCMTYLFCKILGIEAIKEKMGNIKTIMEKYEPKVFDITIPKKAHNKEFFNIEINSLIKFLVDISKINKLSFKEIEIDYMKNNEDFNDLEKINSQMKILMFSSKIKLNSYGINESDNIKVISEILKVNASQSSISSVISGLAIIQLFNMLNDPKFIDFLSQQKNENKINDNSNEDKNKINDNKSKSLYKNAVFNLSNNIYLLFNVMDS